MAGGADHLLLDTVRRRLRQPAGWVAVALHLSRLAAPAPRPHHRRIARVLMEDAARRHEGQVFAPANGDLLLLCRAGDERRPAAVPLRVASPQALPEILARLLRADIGEPRELVSLWPLETSGEEVLTYALDRVGTATTILAPAAAERHAQPGTVDAIAAAIDGADAAELVRRQTAVLIAEDGMRPLFREVRFSLSALEQRVARSRQLDCDPFLFRHLAERFDRRLLELVGAAVGRGGALDPTAALAPRLHLNLTLPSLRSEGFARLAEALLGRGLSLGVQVSLLDACADPDRFEQARGALRRLNMTLVLDGVSHQALALGRLSELQPDLLKLAWSPPMAGLPPDAGQRRLIRELGPDRVVLHRADNEAALRWGLEYGIRRFQGRHVDAMLGALRLSACEFATGCSFNQCVERAATAHASGRYGCRNATLLDFSAPGQNADAMPDPGLLAASERLRTTPYVTA